MHPAQKGLQPLERIFPFAQEKEEEIAILPI